MYGSAHNGISHAQQAGLEGALRRSSTKRQYARRFLCSLMFPQPFDQRIVHFGLPAGTSWVSGSAAIPRWIAASSSGVFLIFWETIVRFSPLCYDVRQTGRPCAGATG
jgi:hypothetical protein